MKTIALDFDAVIHQYTGWNDGVLNEPIFGAKEVIENFINRNFNVVIYTTRDKKSVEQWLKKYEFPQIEVSNDKPLCFVLVDDRAYKFEGKWTVEIAREIENFKAYWEKEK